MLLFWSFTLVVRNKMLCQSRNLDNLRQLSGPNHYNSCTIFPIASNIPSNKLHVPFFSGILSDDELSTGQDSRSRDLDAIKASGRKCGSVCCTGGLLVETMLAVLVSPELDQVKRGLCKHNDNLWNSQSDVNKITSHYFVVSILSDRFSETHSQTQPADLQG